MAPDTNHNDNSMPTPADDGVLLSVTNLSTDFVMKKGVVHAVIDVSFHICEGEVLAIVGESGSGKSVTALSALGLLQHPGRVVGGEACFRGRNLLKLSSNEMRSVRGNQISMIFQEPIFSPMAATIRAALNPSSRRSVRFLSMRMASNSTR